MNDKNRCQPRWFQQYINFLQELLMLIILVFKTVIVLVIRLEGVIEFT